MGRRHPANDRRKRLGVGASLMTLGGIAAIWLGASDALGWTIAGIGMAGVLVFGTPGSGDGDGGSDDGGDGGGDGGGE